MKQRADLLLVERGLSDSRSKAQALIMAGLVYSGDRRIDKPGVVLLATAPLRLIAQARFVSRGGEKLERAIVELMVPVAAKACVDIGASTGGFCDCLLQHGAKRVYAVDVGYGQLHQKLRADPRVVCRERTNARDLTAHDFDEVIDLVVVDASFIGIGKLMPAIAAILPQGGELVALVKPQFEAGRDEASKGRGVIRDAQVRLEAITKAVLAIESHGFRVVASADSPIAGPKGNVEHLVYSRRV